MKLVIGNDHAAVELKIEIKAYLEEKGHEVINIGTDTHDSCNYPEYGEKAGRMVAAGEADGGVLICGTGVGISIAANKVKGVRAAVCSEPVTARLVKEHNNANIIAFGARIVGSETAKAIVDAWLDAKFQGGRHQTRIDMIHKIEEYSIKRLKNHGFSYRIDRSNNYHIFVVIEEKTESLNIQGGFLNGKRRKGNRKRCYNRAGRQCVQSR